MIATDLFLRFFNGLGDLGDILCLVADPLHIGDHFKCRGNLTQVACYRLLLQKKLQTKVFDLSFPVVDMFVGFVGQLPHFFGSLVECTDRIVDCFLAQCSHVDQQHVELRQLFIKSCRHISQTSLLYNLPSAYPSVRRKVFPSCQTLPSRPAGKMLFYRIFSLPAAYYV